MNGHSDPMPCAAAEKKSLKALNYRTYFYPAHQSLTAWQRKQIDFLPIGK
jgi:hypothetical protein